MPIRDSREPGCPSSVSEQVLEVGARLARNPSERLIQTAFKRELDDQADLFEGMSWVDLAHTLVMMEAGIVPREAGRDLLAALLKLHERPADFTLDPSRGDLYTNREAWLATQTGASTWLGAGRARREATTTAFLIKARAGLLGLAEALATTGKVITARASFAAHWCPTILIYNRRSRPLSVIICLVVPTLCCVTSIAFERFTGV